MRIGVGQSQALKGQEKAIEAITTADVLVFETEMLFVSL